MSNNPFLEDLDALEVETMHAYRFEFPNGDLATVTSHDKQAWRLLIHRPIPPRGKVDLEDRPELTVEQVRAFLEELRVEPAGVEQPSTAYRVPDDA